MRYGGMLRGLGIGQEVSCSKNPELPRHGNIFATFCEEAFAPGACRRGLTGSGCAISVLGNEDAALPGGAREPTRWRE
jgi:hypothetical protein